MKQKTVELNLFFLVRFGFLLPWNYLEQAQNGGNAHLGTIPPPHAFVLRWW